MVAAEFQQSSVNKDFILFANIIVFQFSRLNIIIRKINGYFSEILTYSVNGNIVTDSVKPGPEGRFAVVFRLFNREPDKSILSEIFRVGCIPSE